MNTPRTRGVERGQSLVGLLLVVLIIGIGLAVYFGRQPEPQATRPGGPTTQLGQDLEKGSEVDCANNLRQIRLAIEMYKNSDPVNPTLPSSLQELSGSGIGPSMLNCPVTGNPYQYNPATGQVWCTTPGHERF